MSFQRPTRNELLYLADQEQHERGMMQPDAFDDRRASLVKEWALREAASQVTNGHQGGGA
jgi:hypothetical protein